MAATIFYKFFISAIKRLCRIHVQVMCKHVPADEGGVGVNVLNRDFRRHRKYAPERGTGNTHQSARVRVGRELFMHVAVQKSGVNTMKIHAVCVIQLFTTMHRTRHRRPGEVQRI